MWIHDGECVCVMVYTVTNSRLWWMTCTGGLLCDCPQPIGKPWAHLQRARAWFDGRVVSAHWGAQVLSHSIGSFCGSIGCSEFLTANFGFRMFSTGLKFGKFGAWEVTHMIVANAASRIQIHRTTVRTQSFGVRWLRSCWCWCACFVVGAIGWLHYLFLCPATFLLLCVCERSSMFVLYVVCLCACLGLFAVVVFYYHIYLAEAWELLSRVIANQIAHLCFVSCINFVLSAGPCINELHVMLEFDVCWSRTCTNELWWLHLCGTE